MCSGERYYQGALHQYVREALWKHMHCAINLCKLAEMVAGDEGKMSLHHPQKIEIKKTALLAVRRCCTVQGSPVPRVLHLRLSLINK